MRFVKKWEKKKNESGIKRKNGFDEKIKEMTIGGKEIFFLLFFRQKGKEKNKYIYINTCIYIYI